MTCRVVRKNHFGYGSWKIQVRVHKNFRLDQFFKSDVFQWKKISEKKILSCGNIWGILSLMQIYTDFKNFVPVLKTMQIKKIHLVQCGTKIVPY